MKIFSRPLPASAPLAGALLFLGLIAAGCGKSVPQTASSAASNAPSVADAGSKVLRIGYQKGTVLHVLRLRGDLERALAPQGVTVQWLDFPAGPQTLEALATGNVDFSAMGDTPPIFAQAAGIPVVYVADQPPTKDSGRALIVPRDSPIKTIADLRGKRIAVQKGSGTHSFLIQALQKAGIPYSAVTVSFLPPADARAAFASGAVDAWAIWDPFLAVAQKQMQARTIADGSIALTDGGFYVSTRTFAVQHPDWVRTVLDQSGKTSHWIADRPQDAAALLAPNLGLDVPTLIEVEKRSQNTVKGIGYATITEDLWNTQQSVADLFLKVGLLPKHVNVRDGALTPAQYAALTPPQTAPAKVAAVAK